MELYWGSGSSYAWRVMLGLLFKGMAYEDHLLSFAKREHKAGHYTQLNPRGKVPTLVDGEVVVIESIAILAYLDRAHPRKLLFGGTAADAGRIWSRVMEIENYLNPPAMNAVRALFFDSWKEHRAELKEALGKTFEELDMLERDPESGPFTAVDCMLVPLLESLERASLKPGATEIGLRPFVLAKRWPHLAARLKAVRALPGYDRTFPPHWR